MTLKVAEMEIERAFTVSCTVHPESCQQQVSLFSESMFVAQFIFQCSEQVEPVYRCNEETNVAPQALPLKQSMEMGQEKYSKSTVYCFGKHRKTYVPENLGN